MVEGFGSGSNFGGFAAVAVVVVAAVDGDVELDVAAVEECGIGECMGFAVAIVLYGERVCWEG